jgi:hypothetical protein
MPVVRWPTGNEVRGTDELLGPFRVNEARLPRAQDPGHLGRVDVLVSVFGIVRPEQLGELLAGVVDEVGERPQAGQDHQVAGVELLPHLVP